MDLSCILFVVNYLNHSKANTKHYENFLPFKVLGNTTVQFKI